MRVLLIDVDSTIPNLALMKISAYHSALARCEMLREWGALPYPMFNRSAPRTKRMTDLKRWCRPWIFFTTEWANYSQKITLQKGRGEKGNTLTQKKGNIGGSTPLDSFCR